MEDLKNAILHTPLGYLAQIIGERTAGSPNASGSTFTKAPKNVIELLEMAEEAKAYTPPDHLILRNDGVQVCQYFISPHAGHIGLIDLKALPADQEIHLVDPKDTIGKTAVADAAGVVAEVRYKAGTNVMADFTVWIVGPDKDGPPVLWTLHPGELVPSTERINDPELVGKVVTPSEALELGLTVAKVVS